MQRRYTGGTHKKAGVSGRRVEEGEPFPAAVDTFLKHAEAVGLTAAAAAT